jgi:hypothetical protein
VQAIGADVKYEARQRKDLVEQAVNTRAPKDFGSRAYFEYIGYILNFPSRDLRATNVPD